MTGIDAFQFILIGAGTGFGSALGTELAKFIITTIREKKNGKA